MPHYEKEWNNRLRPRSTIFRSSRLESLLSRPIQTSERIGNKDLEEVRFFKFHIFLFLTFYVCGKNADMIRRRGVLADVGTSMQFKSNY